MLRSEREVVGPACAALIWEFLTFSGHAITALRQVV
jgi:hypothetical protein